MKILYSIIVPIILLICTPLYAGNCYSRSYNHSCTYSHINTLNYAHTNIFREKIIIPQRATTFVEVPGLTAIRDIYGDEYLIVDNKIIGEDVNNLSKSEVVRDRYGRVVESRTVERDVIRNHRGNVFITTETIRKRF